MGLVTAAATVFETGPLGIAAGVAAAVSTYKALSSLDSSSSGGGSVAEAASSPGLPATARQAITSPDPGALLHPIPGPSPILLGDPIAEPGRTMLDHPIAAPGSPILDHPIDSPRPGIMGYPLLDEPQSLYDALDVSDTPKPTDKGIEGKPTPSILQGTEKVGKNRWRRGKGRHREYIEKDKLHQNEYEVWDRFGRHKGAFDETGRMIKPPKRDRRME